jgi:hypothetical protein
MSIAGIAFLSPWLLAALAALPVIYWLLRTVPPRPRQIAFPPTRILVGIENKEKTTTTTPWWLTLLRMLAATLVILALADPVRNLTAAAQLRGDGPVVVVVDNGWTSASQWQLRDASFEAVMRDAEAAGRPMLVVPTALVAKTVSLRIEAPAQARSTLTALRPQPHAPDRAVVMRALEQTLATTSGVPSIVWLADGVVHGEDQADFARRLEALSKGGSVSVILPQAGREALGLAADVATGGRLGAIVTRAAEEGARSGVVHAYSARGQRLGEAAFELGAGAQRTTAQFEMPLELRNQVARIEIATERAAGAHHLLDARAQWHRVGLISGASREQAQPLLAPLYYIERALAPFAELAKTEDTNLASAIDTLIKRNTSVIMLADVGTLPADVRTRVDEFVRKGGVLVRFAGARLESGGDELLPVPLRAGGRSLGGALSWSTPQPLAPIADDSVFAGLAVPADVLVNRQVLADPARIDPNVKIWARLRDGTPLVTAARRGEGQVVLFHVTANSDWSNLPLSGLFVEMLRRIATLGGETRSASIGSNETTTTNAPVEQPPSTDAAVLSPLQVLDGYGVLKPPPPTAEALPLARLGQVKPSPDHPPGYYGPAGAARAFNVMTLKDGLRPLTAWPTGASVRGYDGQKSQSLKPGLLMTALALLLVDILAVLALQGWFARVGRAVRPAAAVLAFGVMVALIGATPSDAQVPLERREFLERELNLPGIFGKMREAVPRDPNIANLPPDLRRIIDATGRVTFAYVVSGDAAADRASRYGLSGLVKFLAARTAVEAGEPMAVNIVTDEIAFFPLLYWPVLPNPTPLSSATLAKIDAYMKNGGMIIFDTRDAGMGGLPRIGPDGQSGTPLQRLLGNLDVPRLEAVPEHHVLTKSFYLLRAFPGRWDSGQMWVEAEAPSDSSQGRQARRVDGVTSLIITSNDLAAAWAIDERNQPMFPVVPGGERQREMAFRTGVNIVMYALTGNYKADQVHVPALLERLGQ